MQIVLPHRIVPEPGAGPVRLLEIAPRLSTKTSYDKPDAMISEMRMLGLMNSSKSLIMLVDNVG